MKKFISLVLLFVFAIPMHADNYKILWMNTNNIKIGTKVCTENSVFSDRSTIIWTKQGQAFEAQNLRTKEIDLFAEPAFKIQKSKSILEYYIRTNHMSTRSTHPTAKELKVNLSDTFYMTNEICVNCSFPTDSCRYFFVRYEKDGKLIERMLYNKNDCFVIPRSLFTSDDTENNKEIKLCVYYRDVQADEELLLTDSMVIQILPLKYKNAR